LNLKKIPIPKRITRDGRESEREEAVIGNRGRNFQALDSCVQGRLGKQGGKGKKPTIIEEKGTRMSLKKEGKRVVPTRG